MALESSQSSEVKVQVSYIPERTLVLVGRTGNGKSATGNCILGENAFVSKARGKFITKQSKMSSATLPNGVKVNVIDTPGLFSASMSIETTSREIIRCLRMAKKGIDAMLLVFSVRNRLTEEEKSTLPTLKILFGDKIVEYMIVVFTNADALEEDETLDDYLEDCSEFQDIINECGKRKVLFDNSRGASQDVKDKQVQDLLALVTDIVKNNNGQPYISELSNKLKNDEEMLEEKLKQIEEMKLSSKDIILLKKEYEKKYKEMVTEAEKKVTTQLKDSENVLKDKLAKSEAEKEEAEKKLKESSSLSNDMIMKLKEQVKKAEKETASLKAQLASKICTVL